MCCPLLWWDVGLTLLEIWWFIIREFQSCVKVTCLRVSMSFLTNNLSKLIFSNLWYSKLGRKILKPFTQNFPTGTNHNT